MPLYFAHNTKELHALLGEANDTLAGGHVQFVGSVRLINKEKVVKHLVYEAYESLAISEFNKLEQKAKEEFFINSVRAVHRVGHVPVGDEAVIISVSAKHREQAFTAARFLVDELKKKLPIWKEEHYEDGTASFDQGSCCFTLNENHDVLGPLRHALHAQNIKPDLVQKARVLLIGAGGLGCPLAQNLAALGVSLIDLFDGDQVEASNLARQLIFKRSDIGKSKAFLVADFIGERFNQTKIIAHERNLSRKEARAIIGGFDLVLDASDCIKTKMMLADEARLAQVPFICGSVFQDQGELLFINAITEQGCFSCFRPRAKELLSCATTGVFTHTCAMIAALASSLALKVLAKKERRENFMIIVDDSGVNRQIGLKKDPHCSQCSTLRVLK